MVEDKEKMSEEELEELKKQEQWEDPREPIDFLMENHTLRERIKELEKDIIDTKNELHTLLENKEAELEQALEVLMDVVHQTCWDTEKGLLDDYAISSYEEAFEFLERYGFVKRLEKADCFAMEIERRNKTYDKHTYTITG